MTTLTIQDPWFEGIYKSEFNNNPTKFLETVKELLLERYQKEQKIKALLKEYEKGEISLGKIGEKLGVDREAVLSLMVKHNVYLIDNDYDLSADEETIQRYLLAK